MITIDYPRAVALLTDVVSEVPEDYKDPNSLAPNAMCSYQDRCIIARALLKAGLDESLLEHMDDYGNIGDVHSEFEAFRREVTLTPLALRLFRLVQRYQDRADTWPVALEKGLNETAPTNPQES